MTTPWENCRGKNRKFTNPRYWGDGGGVPPIGKRPIYFRFFLLKASLTQYALNNQPRATGPQCSKDHSAKTKKHFLNHIFIIKKASTVQNEFYNLSSTYGHPQLYKII